MVFYPCSGLGVFLLLAAVILLVFAELGQISLHQLVPRHIRLASLTTTDFGVALATATGSSQHNLTDLYASGPNGPDGTVGTGSIAAGNGSGIGAVYQWGLWGYCSGQFHPGSHSSYCSSTTPGHRFTPGQTLLSDSPPQYSNATQSLIPPSTFTSQRYLKDFSKWGFWTVFVGTLMAGIGMFVGLVGHRIAYLFSAALAFLSSILVSIGVIIWTVIITKTKSGLEGLHVQNDVGLGLKVDYGNALWMMWAADAALVLSIVPFFLACCSIRARSYY